MNPFRSLDNNDTYTIELYKKSKSGDLLTFLLLSALTKDGLTALHIAVQGIHGPAGVVGGGVAEVLLDEGK